MYLKDLIEQTLCVEALKKEFRYSNDPDVAKLDQAEAELKQVAQTPLTADQQAVAVTVGNIIADITGKPFTPF